MASASVGEIELARSWNHLRTSWWRSWPSGRSGPSTFPSILSYPERRLQFVVRDSSVQVLLALMSSGARQPPSSAVRRS